MLIIDNIDLQVRSFPRVYESVIDVWVKSLETMENLVSGIAQSIESPEMLLGLTSWHLYPDLAVLREENKHVVQCDKLVPKGGLVTIGLHGCKTRNESGITWTMPLAQMRYYGDPIRSTRSIGTKSLRVSFDNIVYIAMGSAISNWSSSASDLESVCKFWMKLAARCDLEVLELDSTPLAWLRVFSVKASLFLIAKEAEKKEAIRFVNLGKGRYRGFLGSAKEHPGPALGLGDISTFLSMLDIEDQIRVLRELVEDYDLGADLRGAMIFYHPSGATHAEFATLYREQQGTSQVIREKHRRWITGIKKMSVGASTAHRGERRDRGSPSTDDGCDSQPKLDVEATIKRTIEIMKFTGEPCGIIPSGTVTNRDGGDIESHWKIQFSEHSTFLHWNHHSGSVLDFAGLQQYCNKKMLRPEVTHQLMLGWEIGSTKHKYENVKFTRLFGSNSVLVYQPIESRLNQRGVLKPPILPLNFLSNALESLPKEETRMVEYLGLKLPLEKKTLRCRPLAFPLYLQSLENLHQASLVYSQMPSATINPAIATYPLHSAQWADYGSNRLIRQEVYTAVPPSNLGLEPSEGSDLSNQPREPKKRSKSSILSRPNALALIASFDSGGLQIDPLNFEDVIAVSSGNSLYVSEALLNDPTSIYDEIRCLVGNVGKAGIALLLSPRDPIVKTNDAEVWEMINHEEFDGRWEDNFRSTSLHLKLTGYELPINVGQHGSRYQEVLYAETIVSAHSRGQWVADINVLSLYAEGSTRSWWALTWLEQRLLPVSCQHDDTSKNDHTDFGLLTSIDNWPELLDRPPNTSIIRAKGNWDARLALTAVMRMKEEDVIIASGDVCWACVKAAAGALNLDLEQLLILC
jgi:hypothetical protein